MEGVSNPNGLVHLIWNLQSEVESLAATKSGHPETVRRPDPDLYQNLIFKKNKGK